MPKPPYKPMTPEELDAILPTVLSDLKHHSDPQRRDPNNANIRRDLYQYVIRELFSDTRFRQVEPVEDGREGLFIKGYVRDVWEYLGQAYDAIHATDFEQG